MKNVCALFFVFGLLISCQNDASHEFEQRKTHQIKDELILIPVSSKLDTSVLRCYSELNLVDVKEIDSSILFDLKYGGVDNFMGQKLYDTLDRVFLQREVALRLSKCQYFLDSIRPGFKLFVFDGLRPLQVQQEMWEALDSIPTRLRGRFVSNPIFGSVHNFGAAVDLTIVDAKGIQLDMGAGYDDFREIAFPKHEARFLASGELSQDQVKNRRLLRRVMSSEKFRNIPSEWWHFNAFSRMTASHRFKMVLTESGTSQWFKIEPKIESQSDSLLNPSNLKDTL